MNPVPRTATLVLVIPLLCALIDPCANQADLRLAQRLAFIGRRHPIVLITNAGYVMDQHAFGAVARFDDFSIFPAFEHGLKAIDPELGFLFLLTVALEAGFLKYGFNIFVEGNALGLRDRR